jgi:hypothetical protein
MITRWQKSQKVENQIFLGHLDGLQTVGDRHWKIGHQHRDRTDTLDKMRDMVLQVEKEREEDIRAGIVILLEE